MFQFKWVVKRLTDKMWLRPALYAVLALVTPGLAYLTQGLIPADLPLKIGADAVEQILNILASSLLAVATFSLGTMVSAYSAAANMVTPRATRLLLTDSTSQQVLATFIGAFMFALVSIIISNTGAYTPQGQVILFGATLIVVVIVVFTLVRWVDFLARFGRFNDTIQRVEKAATKAMIGHRDGPFLGANPLADDFRPGKNWHALRATETGYVQAINVQHLEKLGADKQSNIYVMVRPGAFVSPQSALAYLPKKPDDDLAASLRRCVLVGEERNFEQDPRFGLAVLSEIGSRALSAGINDSGTAIDVIGRGLRTLLLLVPGEKGEKPDIDYRHVYIPPLTPDSLLGNFFPPLIRDAANRIEVHIRLQKALLALAECSPEQFGALAKTHSAAAMEWLKRHDLPDAQTRDAARINAEIETVASGRH